LNTLKKLFKIFFILLFLSSCSAQKWCNEKYPPITKDSVWVKTDTLVLYDTIFRPYKEIVFDTTFNFLPPDVVFHSEKKKSGLTSSIDIKGGRIKFKCATDSLIDIIKRLQIEKTNYHLKVDTKWLPCEKEHRKKADIFCRWWTWISIILLIVSIIGYCYIRAFKG